MGLFGSDPKLDLVDTRTQGQTRIGNQLARFLSGGIGRGTQPYRGGFVAGQSKFEKGSLGLLGQLMRGGVNPLFEQAEGALGTLLQGEPTTNIDEQYTQDYFKGIYDESFDRLQTDILPLVEGAYAGNYWSSPRAGATAEAVTGFGQDMSSLLAELVYADQQSKLQLSESAADRQLAATGAAGNLATQKQGLQTGLIQAGQQFGALPRILQQAQLDAKYKDWLRTRPEYNPLLDKALGYLGTPGLTGVVTPGQEGVLPGMLQALMMVGGTALLGPGGAPALAGAGAGGYAAGAGQLSKLLGPGFNLFN
jgi:hypothetical protein